MCAESRRKAGAAVGTVNRELSCLRRGLRLAHRKGRLQAMPHVAVSAEHNLRAGFFEEHEVKHFLGATAPDMASLSNFLYLTGWRTGEAIALEWRQVGFGAGVLRLEPGTTKNGDGRTFPFAALPELAAVLREQRDRTREVERQAGRIIPWVFHRNGAGVGKRGLRLAWMRALKAAKLDGGYRTISGERRCATWSGLAYPRSVAMKPTGHRTESVYRRYAIVTRPT